MRKTLYYVLKTIRKLSVLARSRTIVMYFRKNKGYAISTVYFASVPCSIRERKLMLNYVSIVL